MVIHSAVFDKHQVSLAVIIKNTRTSDNIVFVRTSNCGHGYVIDRMSKNEFFKLIHRSNSDSYKMDIWLGDRIEKLIQLVN